MQFRNKVLFLSIFVVASFQSVNLAEAAQTNLTSDLLLNLGIIYDNNFYYDSEDERGVTTYLIQPGFEFGAETGKSEFAFRYTLDANYYDESDENAFYGHTAFIMGNYEMSDRLSFNLSDNFIKTRDSAELDPLGNIATRDEYFKNRLSAILSLNFQPKFTTRVGYQNLITDYDDDANNDDSMGHQGIFDLIHYLNDSTSLDLEYLYWNMDYDGSTSDYISNQVSLVARKEWRIVALEAAVGYHKRTFDERGLDDIDVVPYRFTLDGSSSSGKTRYSLSAAQNFNLRSDDGYYEANRFSFRVDRDLTAKITLGINGYFQNSDYVYTSRDDDTYEIMADLNYQIRERIAFYFAVSYENRDSNEPDQEYENGMTMGQLRFLHNIAN
jgi:hypothetical protein